MKGMGGGTSGWVLFIITKPARVSEVPVGSAVPCGPFRLGGRTSAEDCGFYNNEAFER